MRLLTCETHEQLKDFNWVNQIKMCATTFFDLPLWQKFGAWKPKTFASLFLSFFDKTIIVGYLRPPFT